MAGVASPKVKAKESGDVNDQTVKKKGENAKIKVDWAKWAGRFGKISDEKLLPILSAELLAVQPKPSVMTLISDKNKDIPDRTERIRRLTLSIMSLPEYQIS